MAAPEREHLCDEEFIRHRIYGASGGALKRYAALVLARPGLGALIRHELITTLLGPIPGLLGIALRRVFYGLLFPAIGRGVVFGTGVVIRHPERIRLGNGVVIDDGVLLDGRGAGDEGLVLGDRVIVNRGAAIQAKVGAITIGAETNVGSLVRIISQGPIRIAEQVSIAGGCTIAGGRYVVDRTEDGAGDKRRFTGGEIRIGAKTRLGMNALVQDGVTIGEAAIVAPASVVMTDVAAHTVVSGFPARTWRERKIRDESAPPRARGDADPGVPRDVGDEVVARQVRAWLEETKFAEFGEGGLRDDDSLFDHDILDSLGLVGLVAWLENTFDLHVAGEDLVPGNLESVAHIVRFVRERTSVRSA
jgi:acetyltransferase-like isoleucine patch superfamily enzyme/acyl carrier protein